MPANADADFTMTDRVDASVSTDIDEEDLIAWRHEGRSYATCRTGKGFFATDLMCTHEQQSLEDGAVIVCVIECPLRGGRFDICTGKALSAPASVDLRTCPVKVEEGRVFVAAGDQPAVARARNAPATPSLETRRHS